MSSVLVTYGLSIIAEAKDDLTAHDKDQITKILSDFTEKKINFDTAKNKLNKIIEANNQLEKLKQIIEVDDNPIPDPGNGDVNGTGKRKKTRTWNDIEDNRLIMAVYKFGLENWNLVAQYVGNGRNRAQCSQRWQRVLDPKLVKSPFSEDEDTKLLKLVEKYGPKLWTKVAQEMGNRCDVQCRYRYRQLKSNEGGDNKQSNDILKANIKSSINPPLSTSSKNIPIQAPTPVQSILHQTGLLNRNSQPQLPALSEPIVAPAPVIPPSDDNIMLAQTRTDSNAIFRSDMDIFNSNDYFR